MIKDRKVKYWKKSKKEYVTCEVARNDRCSRTCGIFNLRV